MYKLDLPVDPREEGARQLRQQRGEARKARIFSGASKQGFEKNDLIQQMEENKLRREQEAEIARRDAEEQLQHARYALLLERQAEQQRRAEAMEASEMLKTLQQTKREHDLQDPMKPRNQKPLRAVNDDEDVHYSASALQQFEGEDPQAAQRLLTQRQQQKDWVQQQLQERKAKDARERQEEEERQRLLRQQAEIGLLMSQREEADRQRQLREAMEENRRMAEEKKRLREEERRRDLDTNFDEMKRQIDSDLLSERPDVAKSYGPKKILPDRYKGMSLEEAAEFRAEQRRQAQLASQQRQREAEEIKEQQRKEAAQARHALLLERQQARQRADDLQRLVSDNQALAFEQTARRTQRDHDKNAIEPSFYDQFGRDYR